MQEAIADLSTELTGMRVLTAEVSSGKTTWLKVDTEALADSKRPVTAVMRINGSRMTPSLSLGALVAQVQLWQRSGVNVVGIEVDHDCATGRLAHYAEWLENLHLPAGLRLSITALPTWVHSDSLRRLSEAVDEVVLQVHAIRAPEIFNARQAKAWILQFSSKTGARPFRVALPTYRVQIDGAVQGADPHKVQRLVTQLANQRPPGMEGIVWFRLPLGGDTSAWSAVTLAAVITNRALSSDLVAKLVPDGPGLLNVVLENRGSLEEYWPGITLTGEFEAADLTSGYFRTKAGWTAPREQLAAGEERIIGWVRGTNVEISVH